MTAVVMCIREKGRKGWREECWCLATETSYLGGVDMEVVDRRYVNEGRDKGYRGPTLISSRQTNVSVCGGGK